ncbi:collagen-like protein [Sunxiuqinia elliptica]|uniref:Uncharacterized protein n=1 Tax=Sunxiuqinia elliptica TaxID=655355 RepID=A0A1I2B5U6_9BACT|nr:collagen-like protein [Sunxiuqinia elliptica]SFE51258.1 hypothetical protein SAMN05216283_101313 [Sunxiuqinia elliptica]
MRALLTIAFFLFILLSGAGEKVHAARLDSIQIIIPKEQLILPGETFNLGVLAYKRNGKIKKNSGLLWRYKVEVVGGTYQAGQITVNPELSPSKGKYIRIKVFPRRHPELTREAYVPLNYETNLEFVPTHSFDKAPGVRVEGQLIRTYNNGQIRVSDKLRKKREAENFRFATDGGFWDKGKFTIHPDFQQIKGHQSRLFIQSVNTPSIIDTFSIQLDYKHNYQLQVYGRSGMDGHHGFSGSDGSFDGADGSPGGHGADGEYGEHAPDIGVWVDLYHDSLLNQPLLYVYAENLWTGKEHRYLINPAGGHFSVNSIGGRGGDGGHGGRGGDGAKGRDGEIWIERKVEKKRVHKPFKETKIVTEKKTITNSEGEEEEIEVKKEVVVTVWKEVEEEVVIEIKHQYPGLDGGNGGPGGTGGIAGDGGDGGSIWLYFTEDARPWQHLIRARSSGGSAGRNGDGGRGGNGGRGGDGKPTGRSGYNGPDGPSVFGWAYDGHDGKIQIMPTEEFFFYLSVTP